MVIVMRDWQYAIAREKGIVRHSQLLLGGGLIALMLFAPHVGLTQPSSEELNKLRFDLLQRDIESLKAGQKAILDELQGMKKLLSSRGVAQGNERSPSRDINTTLSVAEAFAKGDKQATLTLVEFTDYQ
jgi:hypothetical protein